MTFTATSVTYTPATDYVGTDSFTYQVCDNGSPTLCATGTVNVTVTPVTSGLLADVVTTDAEFQRIDGFDVLFANGSGSNKELRATNPGSFHYELDLRNETGVTMHVRGKPLPSIVQNGVSIRDRNGGSVAVIVTVPSLPTNVGTPIPGSAAGYTNLGTPAFRLSGWRPVRANPDDRSDLMPMTVSWANPANGDCLAASVAWTVGTPSSGALVKCLKIEGLEIPRHRKARVHLDFAFAPQGTDGWASNAQSLFRAGFSFKAQTQVTLDPDFPISTLAGKTYVGSSTAGLVGAGQPLTAIGGFVLDGSGTGIDGATVKLFNTAPTPASDRCTSTAFVAQATTEADGFYFIYQTKTTPSSSTANTLPSGVRYDAVVCASGVPIAYLPARLIDHKLGNKEFEQEDFLVANPTHLAWSIQPITNRLGRTMYAVQVSLLDAYGNVVSDGSTQITVSKASGGSGTLSGTLTRTMSGGVATFSDLKISGSSSAAGSYTLKAVDSTGGGAPHPFPQVVSSTFNVTN